MKIRKRIKGGLSKRECGQRGRKKSPWKKDMKWVFTPNFWTRIEKTIGG